MSSIPQPHPPPRPLPPDPRRVEIIPVRLLVVDKIAQRSVDEDRVGRIALEWDWNQAEAATVVEIEGGRFRVTEGQYRVRALEQRDPSASMICIVLPREATGVASEAKLGRAISTGRRNYTSLNKWVSCVTSGEPHEIEAEKVLERYKLRVGQKQSAQTIAAVSAVTKIVHGQKNTPAIGAQNLDTVLQIVMATWPDHDESSTTTRFDGRLLSALGMIVSRNADIDILRMTQKLGTKKAARWISDVLVGGRSSSDIIAGAIIQSYNANIRRASSKIKL